MKCNVNVYVLRTVVQRCSMEIYALIIAFICASSLASPFNTKHYRSDYEYNEKTDAFYKLHTEACIKIRAMENCQTEGADLMLPETQEDIQQVHAMFKKFPDLGDYVMVATDNQKHDMVEEPAMVNLDPEPELNVPSCDVVSRNGDVVGTIASWREAPFMCKVNAKDAPYNEECDVFGNGYVSKIATTGSCYKIPSVAFTWNEAYAECAAENAHLVVLNSEGEHEVVWDLMRTSRLPIGTTTSYFFFAGIRADRPRDGAPRVFRTVLNQTLEEAGYTKWSPDEPNNYQDSEYCGSLFKSDGKYNDLACSHRYAFICEKERRVV